MKKYNNIIEIYTAIGELSYKFKCETLDEESVKLELKSLESEAKKLNIVIDIDNVFEGMKTEKEDWDSLESSFDWDYSETDSDSY